MLGRAYVETIEKLTARDYSLLLEAPQLAAQIVPGQFLHIRIRSSLTPFLRRPFSVAGTFLEKGTIQIVFRVVGEGTAILSQVKKGESLSYLGPLGKGFKLTTESSPAVLLAGGTGVAPLIFLARLLAGKQRQVLLFYGAASAKELLPLQKLLPSAVGLHLATEDGSIGYHGPVTALFAGALQEGGLKPAELFACGPRPMLRKLAEQNQKWNLPLQISLEERMACGLGACQGCAVKTCQGEETTYRLVCHDGPVFDVQEVVWSEWPT